MTGMDLIGAAAPTDNFVVCGNNEESLFGVCESMYKPDLAGGVLRIYLSHLN
jgi:20S proteasome subunit beta 3